MALVDHEIQGLLVNVPGGPPKSVRGEENAARENEVLALLGVCQPFQKSLEHLQGQHFSCCASLPPGQPRTDRLAALIRAHGHPLEPTLSYGWQRSVWMTWPSSLIVGLSILAAPSSPGMRRYIVATATSSSSSYRKDFETHQPLRMRFDLRPGG